MTSSIKRSLWKSFLNTGSLVSPTWSLLNTGITEGEIAMNGKSTEDVYVHEDNASPSVDSYSPSQGVEMSCVNGDAVFEYIDGKRKALSVLTDAESELLNVWLYKGAFGDLYLAERQSVSIPLDTFGGDAGSAAKVKFTLDYVGDPAIGTFDPGTSTFTECDSEGFLSSLVFTGMTLSPQFKSKRTWFKASTAAATNVITGVAVDGDSVITIDLDGDPVVNGAAATWAEGLNLVTITSTNGADVAKYYVFVTYTPA
jgi:hypothetical protein